MKYVILKTPDDELIAYVFSRRIFHNMIGEALLFCDVLGAGFIDFKDGVVRCHGWSASLDVTSRGEEDARIIQDQLMAAESGCDQ